MENNIIRKMTSVVFQQLRLQAEYDGGVILLFALDLQSILLMLFRMFFCFLVVM
jgi:hypothetical protein